MPSAAALRFEIETALVHHFPGALTPRPRILRELAATGVPELDALLDGGLPVGAITEFVGPQCSGRTTLAMATLAEMTTAGKSVAWVDASDTLDPESAAAAGVDLTRQLWVRCGPHAAREPHATETPNRVDRSPAADLLDPGNSMPAPGGGGGSPHPRSEIRGLSQALDAFLQPGTFVRPFPGPRNGNGGRRDRMVGTPSAPNRKLGDRAPVDRTPQDARPFPRRARDREEQVATDRLPSRRQLLQAQGGRSPRTLGECQIANTAAAARDRPQAGHWGDNGNNVHGRAFQTPPNDIAAGLPRFREMEARAASQQTHSAPAAQDGQTATGQPMSGKPGLVSSVPTQAEKPAREPADASLAGKRPTGLVGAASPPWAALDQALRATDLLLAAGGFSALVLDLGSIPAEFAWRIPLATWFRFRAAAERSHAVLLVLTQHPCARSSAELVLRLAPAEAEAATTVLTGARFRIRVDRRRFETQPAPTPTQAVIAGGVHQLHLVPTRKQPQRETGWRRPAAWTAPGTAAMQPSANQNAPQGGPQP